ncbi:hypothetical protein QA640_38405 [Bradyrhizobium sp. CB82]|uniref:hypothetical protein n=1 Tax=Bradyrhizobium sp. CB82 TaxID=3039159 RepID=UPI0024B114E6|nr:hypothetical protein [Bradyrhizobium sp. CB82]WFU40043.1 hypothetical protein QA640_38405 [Bradyrhizobium sp. CB82]
MKVTPLPQIAPMEKKVNPLHLSRFLQCFDEAAAQKGIRLSIGFDFQKYLSITRAIPTKGPTYPNFRPDRSQIKSGEGYWIIGVDRNNEIALLEAARLYNLSHSSLAEHLQSLKAFYSNPAIHAHPEDSCICTAPSAKQLAGKIAYHGDLWVRPDFRGQGIPKIVSGIARGVSYAMWTPDFVCALVARWRVDKGVVAQNGYAHQEPGGSKLRLVEYNIVDDDWLIWVNGKELRSEIERQRTKDLF